MILLAASCSLLGILLLLTGRGRKPRASRPLALASLLFSAVVAGFAIAGPGREAAASGSLWTARLNRETGTVFLGVAIPPSWPAGWLLEEADHRATVFLRTGVPRTPPLPAAYTLALDLDRMRFQLLDHAGTQQAAGPLEQDGPYRGVWLDGAALGLAAGDSWAEVRFARRPSGGPEDTLALPEGGVIPLPW